MTARHDAHADISRRRSRILMRALSHVVAGFEDTNSASKHYNLPPTCGASKFYTREDTCLSESRAPWKDPTPRKQLHIVAGGSFLRNYIQGVVVNGGSIHFWLDPWIISEPLKLKFPALFRMEAEKKCFVADRVKSIGSGAEFFWHWKSILTDPVLLSDLQQLHSLLSSVLIVDKQDKWRWSPHNEGIFSVKSVKRLCYLDRLVSHSFVMDWCEWVPDKCNIHLSGNGKNPD
ncbi:hypothetical protein Hdeb2414_s0023g00638281 [Helianthus debilis subsp. tardiflorus]